MEDSPSSGLRPPSPPLGEKAGLRGPEIGGIGGFFRKPVVFGKKCGFLRKKAGKWRFRDGK